MFCCLLLDIMLVLMVCTQLLVYFEDHEMTLYCWLKHVAVSYYVGSVFLS